MANTKTLVPTSDFPQQQVQSGGVDAPHFIAYILLTIGVILIVFIISRALMLWYWKIYRIIDLLEKIDFNTRDKIDHQK